VLVHMNIVDIKSSVVKGLETFSEYCNRLCNAQLNETYSYEQSIKDP
jgi:hypothetical protein